MKKIISYIPTWILGPMLGIFFLAAWPFLFIWMGLHTLFTDSLDDGKKILILKEIATVFLLLGALFFSYWVFGFPDQ